MTYQMIDFAWWRPSSKADLMGATVLGRYLSHDSGKTLSRAEAELYTSWGVSILANWESTGQGGDRAQGVADAQAAQAQAAAAGMPAGRPIVFSVDVDVTPSSTDAYREGICSVIPAAQVGVYGSAAVCQRWAANGCPWNWRTMSTSWSGGADTTGCKIAQIGIDSGGNVDYSILLTDDVGQWNLNTVPATTGVSLDPTPQEDKNMTMSTPSVNGTAGLSWSAGSAHNIQVIVKPSAAPPQLELTFVNAGQGPVIIGNDNWSNGRVVIPLSSIAASDKCVGVIVEAKSNESTPYWLYSNGQ